MKDEQIKILHLCPDDKFLDGAVRIFEKCMEKAHEYVVYNKRSSDQVKYINDLSLFSYAPPDSPKYLQLLKDCKQGKYSAVIMHSFPSKPWEVINAMRGNGKIALLTWGHEIYDLINTNDLQKITSKLMNTRFKQGAMLHAKRFLRDFCLCLSKRTKFKSNKFLKAMLSVDYICPVIDEDYIELNSKYPKHIWPKMLPFSYSIDINDLSKFDVDGVDHDYIMVGNSATPTCNHLDVFYRLHELGISNTILTPLNYGDQSYGDAIRYEGRKLFGKSFISLDNFMKYDEYIQELRKCRYFVMGHIRQQAVGTIIIALWLGAKVFFFKDSIVYKFLVKNGFHVFNLEYSEKTDFSSELNQALKDNNRIMVESFWGEKSVIHKTKKLLASLLA